MFKTILPLFAVLLVTLTTYAQQAATPQPAPALTQPQAAPCPATPQPPVQPPKGFHFDIPKQLKQTINQQRQKIQDKTGTTVPSPDDLKRQAQQQPCTPPKPTTPANQPPTKPAFVCPPKGQLLPNTSYCLLPDRTVVDAIALPPAFATPAPPAPAAPATAQH